jgi:hypothetical protein
MKILDTVAFAYITLFSVFLWRNVYEHEERRSLVISGTTVIVLLMLAALRLYISR